MKNFLLFTANTVGVAVFLFGIIFAISILGVMIDAT
tara:strand:+ start:94 stop:201 length:108 start_codon:yes stop_codon:yes gene_type:complete